MKTLPIPILRDPRFAFVKRAGLLLRGMLFLGWRFRCPCCGWRLRAYSAEFGILRRSETGYCPRCNAKARHRRIWLYLQENTSLFSERHRLLEVAPWSAFARRFRSMKNIVYLGLDLRRAGPQVTTVGDVKSIPIQSGTIDAAICVHVLEHIEDDQRAIAELYRVLRPGGWAIITVPLRLDAPTHEDPTIRDPQERARIFGEPGHVRFYGTDMIDRIRSPGFDVTFDPASGVSPEIRRRFGLRDDENIFHCYKRRDPGSGDSVLSASHG